MSRKRCSTGAGSGLLSMRFEVRQPQLPFSSSHDELRQPEHQPGLHLYRLTIDHVRLEAPFAHRELRSANHEHQ